MALTVKDVEEFQAYLRGVMDRADHHAGAVKEIALALAGAIIWRKDGDSPIKVMIHNGETKNVLWAQIGGSRYAFSYDHSTGQIEMRQGTTQGQTLHTFSNATPLSYIYQIFESL